MSKHCVSCGEQLSDNAVFCSKCGVAVEDLTENCSQGKNVYNGDRLAFQDFLASDLEYIKEKDALTRKFKKEMTLCYVGVAVFAVIMFVGIFVFFVNPPVGGIMVMGGLFAMLVPGIAWAVLESRKKNRLESLAETHYRNYMEKFN